MLSGSPGIAFTDVTINTIVPYIYTVSATTLPGSDPLDFGITFPNTGFAVGDSDGGDPFLSDGQSRRYVRPGERLLHGELNLLGKRHDHDRQPECPARRYQTSMETRSHSRP